MKTITTSNPLPKENVLFVKKILHCTALSAENGCIGCAATNITESDLHSNISNLTLPQCAITVFPLVYFVCSLKDQKTSHLQEFCQLCMQGYVLCNVILLNNHHNTFCKKRFCGPISYQRSHFGSIAAKTL